MMFSGYSEMSTSIFKALSDIFTKAATKKVRSEK